MFKSVNEYLDKLKNELKGSDSALIQDALSDAEEYLRTALESASEDSLDVSEAEALQPIIEKYGDPSEIASAYKDIESRISPALAPVKQPKVKNPLAQFFGVLGDARAWGAFFYMLFAIVTGTIYGTWAITGLSFSLSMLILIIGIPITALFLLSVRGIALVEGRIVEALLGERMPRKPMFVSKDKSWLDKLKALFIESQTWKALAYMFLYFPLGIVYFTLSLTLFALSLSLIVGPILRLVLGLPFWEIDNGSDAVAAYWMPFIFIGGFFLLALTMHFVKLVGKVHGRFAKFMLVRR
jgi:hypothetical protein